MKKRITFLSLVFVLCLFAFVATNWLGTVNADSDEDGNESAFRADETAGLSPFSTSIAEKMKYEKFYEPRSPSIPLPKTELTDIVFSRKWLIKNDTDSDPGTITITFPIAWLKKSPRVIKDDAVNLRIPKTMLELNDISNDPREITVSFNSYLFFGYSNSSEEITDYPAIEQSLTTKDESVKSAPNTFYKSNVYFYRNRLNLVNLEGRVNAYRYYNTGETFRSYHEHEIGMNSFGDTVEIVTDFEDNGDIGVWVAVWDGAYPPDERWRTPDGWLRIDVVEQQPVNYFIYLTPGSHYTIVLHDVWNDLWRVGVWYDSDPTQIDWITASTELYDFGGISHDFEVVTWPLIAYRAGSSSYWYSLQSAFDYHSTSATVPYVYTWYTFNNHWLYTGHRANF